MIAVNYLIFFIRIEMILITFILAIRMLSKKLMKDIPRIEVILVEVIFFKF